MASILTPIIHALQVALSARSLYLASISISNLQEYEETSEKAAEYSNTAERQLHKTRTTQASGTGAVSICSMFHCAPYHMLTDITDDPYFHKLDVTSGVSIRFFESSSEIYRTERGGAQRTGSCSGEDTCGEFLEGKGEDSIAGGGRL
jgi:hypothetical protein